MEATAAPALEPRQDGDDTPYRLGDAPRHVEAIDDRLEEAVSGIDAILRPAARFLERFGEQDGNQHHVVERTALVRDAVDFVEQAPERVFVFG